MEYYGGVIELVGVKIVLDWVRQLKRIWTSQLQRIEQRAERKAKARSKRN
jgi:hypothetical protein